MWYSIPVIHNFIKWNACKCFPGKKDEKAILQIVCNFITKDQSI